MCATESEGMMAEKDDMILKTDIVAGVIRTEKGYAVVAHPKNREELVRSLGELQIMITREVIKVDGVNKITKQGGILNFARRRF